MKDLNDYFSQATNTLYHYTGVGALLGIVESKTLFATHAYYLNDVKEITHASSVLTDAITKYEGCNDDEERAFLLQFSEWLQSLRKGTFGVFIFSLSAEQSLLSQWRSYTPHGKGVSLGFSTDFLNDLLRENNFRLAKCIYDFEEQRHLVSALVEKMFVSFRRHRSTLDLASKHYETRYFEFLEEFRGDLLQVLAIIKHPSFSEEREWRIVSTYFSSFKSPNLRFREGSSMLIPYIEIPFPAAKNGKKIFGKVVLGPSQDQNLAMDALGSFLSNKEMCDHRLNCGIPYRKW